MITYTDTIDGIDANQLQGFFQGWPSSPSPQTHLRILAQSDHVLLAIHTETRTIVGFITAISDGILSACIPLLEVLPEYQHRGIGSRLVQTMLERLSALYMVDVVCDANIVPFYQKLGMLPGTAAMLRRPDVTTLNRRR
jgi:ribosomal protein S18 acetylase RimI-like enzyme